MGIVQSVPFTTRDVGEGESPELSARLESGLATSDLIVAQRRLTGKETRRCC